MVRWMDTKIISKSGSYIDMRHVWIGCITVHCSWICNHKFWCSLHGPTAFKAMQGAEGMIPSGIFQKVPTPSGWRKSCLQRPQVIRRKGKHMYEVRNLWRNHISMLESVFSDALDVFSKKVGVPSTHLPTLALIPLTFHVHAVCH